MATSDDKFRSYATLRQWFSVREVAEIFGVSDRTVERMIKSGELRAMKLRRRTLIHYTAVDELALVPAHVRDLRVRPAEEPVVIDRRRRKRKADRT